MVVRLLCMMGMIMFVCGCSLDSMRLIVIVGVSVFVTMLMGVDGTAWMCMFMAVGVNVRMSVFFFFHCDPPFLFCSPFFSLFLCTELTASL